MSECDDEPHWFCQECPACLHNEDEEPDAGTALLDQNRRMREALMLIIESIDMGDPYEADLYAIEKLAKAALEAKL